MAIFEKLREFVFFKIYIRSREVDIMLDRTKLGWL
jgi:hypothetical protein